MAEARKIKLKDQLTFLIEYLWRLYSQIQEGKVKELSLIVKADVQDL